MGSPTTLEARFAAWWSGPPEAVPEIFRILDWLDTWLGRTFGTSILVATLGELAAWAESRDGVVLGDAGRDAMRALVDFLEATGMRRPRATVLELHPACEIVTLDEARRRRASG